MKIGRLYPFLIIGFFVIISLFIFRQYFIFQRVPFPSNLLVSFYSPFRYESWQGYERGVPNKPIGFDVLRIFYPYKKFTLEALQSGSLPLWNPYVFAGNVHLATYQSAVFYPLNIVYRFFSLVDGWSLLVVIQPVLTAIFTYIFLRSLFLSRRASLFGGFSFAFSGWMIAWWEESLVIAHSILWLPLVLYASKLIWQSKQNQRRGTILLIAGLVFSILAGFMQVTIYLFGSYLLWNIYYWRANATSTDKKKIISILIATILAIGLTSIQWLPALEAYLLSARPVVGGKFIFELFLMPLEHLITFIAPDFWGNPGSYNYFFPKVFYHDRVIYIGIIPLIFAIYAYLKAKGWEVKFWKVFSLVVLSLGFALPTSWVWYVLRVPVLSVAHPGRIFVLSTFGLAVLAAFGLEKYLQKPDKGLMKKILVFLSIMLLALWGFVGIAQVLVRSYPSFHPACGPKNDLLLMQLCKTVSSDAALGIWKRYATVSLRNLFLPSIFIFMSWVVMGTVSKSKNFFFTCTLTLSLISSLYFANKYLYFSERRFVFPEIPVLSQLKNMAKDNRIWTYGNAYVEANILSYYGIYSAEGYDPLFPQRYGELTYTIKTAGKFTAQITRADADLKGAAEIESMTENPYRLRLLSLLGVRYILESKLGEHKDVLSTGKRFPESLFTLVWQNEKWRIWEYRLALPRAFFVDQYVVERDQQKIIDAIYSDQFDLRQKIILEEDPQESFMTPTQGATKTNITKVDLLTYKSQSLEYLIEVPHGGFLFISDNYFPGWKAFVDGKQVKIYRADYSFRAISVPGGRHKVSLVYDPNSVKYGIYLSLASLIFTAGFVYFSKTQSKITS